MTDVDKSDGRSANRRQRFPVIPRGGKEMKRGIAAFALCLSVMLEIHPAVAQDHWYWTLDPGNSKTYVNKANSQDLVFQWSDGEAYDATIWWSRHEIEGSLVTGSASLFSLDAEGNVWLHG
jgi:hypothetical protein